MRAACFLFIAITVTAQQPPITNAKLQTSSASGGLQPVVKRIISNSTSPLWIGYAVPAIPGDRHMCDDSKQWGPVRLEGPSHVYVLVRVESEKIGKIRTVSIDCPIDAGGLTLHWLTDVRPADSVAMLEGQAGASAVHAIAMHAGPEADQSLDKLAASQNEEHRKAALFWLANSRGRHGFEVVSRAATQDQSEKVREHAAFALTLSKESGAIPAIIRMAKEDTSPRVRGQALFWLAQKASREASKEITNAIERDPDTEVKKKAVFALSQLPREEGVPLLINVARNNANAAVRKQAMFWLGQSKDPRALKFFEDVLTK